MGGEGPDRVVTRSLVELRNRRTVLVASALTNLMLGASAASAFGKEARCFLTVGALRAPQRRGGRAIEFEDVACNLDGAGLASALAYGVRDLDGLALFVGKGLNAEGRPLASARADG